MQTDQDYKPILSNREGLPFVEGGYVQIGTKEELDRVLAHKGEDISSVIVYFSVAKWSELNSEERIAACQFLDGAVAQVCAAGLLPLPQEKLPPFGTRAEALMAGGKPGPASKYGTGTVDMLGWDSVFHTWRVGVRFDEVTGYWMGGPVRGVQAFPNQIHVIGSDERPFSTMTPAELVILAEERRQEFWRQPGLAQPQKERQEYWRNLESVSQPQSADATEERNGLNLDSLSIDLENGV